MIRTLRLPLAVLALAISALSPAAQAQFSVYGEFTVSRMTGIASSPVLQTLSPLPCTGSTTTNCTAYNNFANPLGFTGGATYDFKTFGPFTLGADLRGIVLNTHQGAQSTSEGSGTHLYSGLGGIHASVRTPLSALRAYVQGSAGYARSNYGVLTAALHNGSTYPTNPLFPAIPTENNLDYHVYAGADLRFLPYADWRIAEVGYGALESFGAYSHSYPLYSVSTGIVFHIPPRP